MWWTFRCMTSFTFATVLVIDIYSSYTSGWELPVFRRMCPQQDLVVYFMEGKYHYSQESGYQMIGTFLQMLAQYIYQSCNSTMAAFAYDFSYVNRSSPIRNHHPYGSCQYEQCAVKNFYRLTTAKESELTEKRAILVNAVKHARKEVLPSFKSRVKTVMFVSNVIPKPAQRRRAKYQFKLMKKEFRGVRLYYIHVNDKAVDTNNVLRDFGVDYFDIRHVWLDIVNSISHLIKALNDYCCQQNFNRPDKDALRCDKYGKPLSVQRPLEPLHHLSTQALSRYRKARAAYMQSPSATCKVDKRGMSYKGNLAEAAGSTCRIWSSKEVLKHIKANDHLYRKYTDWSTSDQNSNFCRNLDGSEDGPWCYIVDEYVPSHRICELNICKGNYEDKDGEETKKESLKGLYIGIIVGVCVLVFIIGEIALYRGCCTSCGSSFSSGSYSNRSSSSSSF